jgi:hypothetical protein
VVGEMKRKWFGIVIIDQYGLAACVAASLEIAPSIANKERP